MVTGEGPVTVMVAEESEAKRLASFWFRSPRLFEPCCPDPSMYRKLPSSLV